MSKPWIEKAKTRDGKMRGYKPRWREGGRKLSGPVFQRKGEAESYIQLRIMPDLISKGYTRDPDATTLIEWLDQYNATMSANQLRSPSYREYVHYHVGIIKRLIATCDAGVTVPRRIASQALGDIKRLHIIDIMTARQNDG